MSSCVWLIYILYFFYWRYRVGGTRISNNCYHFNQHCVLNRANSFSMHSLLSPRLETPGLVYVCSICFFLLLSEVISNFCLFKWCFDLYSWLQNSLITWKKSYQCWNSKNCISWFVTFETSCHNLLIYTWVAFIALFIIYFLSEKLLTIYETYVHIYVP